MKLDKIKSLDDLKREKDRLHMESEICLAALSHRSGTLRKEVRKFVVGKVAIPLGIAGLIGIFWGKDNKSEKKEDGQNDSSGFLKTLMPFLIPIAKDFITNTILENEKETSEAA
ncbi:MAG: hypothetical protein GYB31_10315 [Bacteroidetes bacterium]|nr:hypothetical protein [Bacteroidota bacterium]